MTAMRYADEIGVTVYSVHSNLPSNTITKFYQTN